MENKPESREDEENGGGWFLPWICLVALFGIIIVDSLMNADSLKKDQSFGTVYSEVEALGFGISLYLSLFSYCFSSSER